MAKKKRHKLPLLINDDLRNVSVPAEFLKSMIFHSITETRDQFGNSYRSETIKSMKKSSRPSEIESTYVNSLPEVKKLMSPKQSLNSNELVKTSESKNAENARIRKVKSLKNKIFRT